MKENLDVEKTEEVGKVKKALLVTRVSGFIPQHEMNNVKILQEMGYEVHYATNLNVVVYGKDNSRLSEKRAPQINRSTLRFSNLFHRTGDTFCKLLLQNEEYNHGRNGTE